MKLKEVINKFGNVDRTFNDVQSVSIQYNDNGEVLVWLLPYDSSETTIVKINKETIKAQKNETTSSTTEDSIE